MVDPVDNRFTKVIIFLYIYIYLSSLGIRKIVLYYYIVLIVELRTPAMPVGVGGGKERGGFHLNLRT